MMQDLQWWADVSQIIGAIGTIIGIILMIVFRTNQSLQWLKNTGIYLLIASVFFLLGIFFPKPQEQEIHHNRQVFASTFPFENTRISVTEGDNVQIHVEGDDAMWNCGTGLTSPEGQVGNKYSQFVLPDADLCELIGFVEPGKFFRIGSYQEFTATNDGTLFLGANDESRNDKFIDNQGTLTVRIIVRKRAQ